MAQTAEGAMDEMVTMYQRVRTLALQSANGTNSTADRTAIQQEVSSLCAEIDRISEQTTFGGEKILNGSKTTVDFQVGADHDQKISVDLSNGQTGDDDDKGWSVSGLAAKLGKTLKTLTDAEKPNYSGTKGVVFDVSTDTAAQTTLGNIDAFIAAVDSKRAEFGAVQNRLESTIRNQSNVSENVSAARSRIRDTDFASETAAMTQQNIIQQASQSILSQANQRPQVEMSGFCFSDWIIRLAWRLSCSRGLKRRKRRKRSMLTRTMKPEKRMLMKRKRSRNGIAAAGTQAGISYCFAVTLFTFHQRHQTVRPGFGKVSEGSSAKRS